MWVFGYGSLIWDGWERDHRCIRRVQADLYGYSRVFNKPSVVRWGTRNHPGPTLNLGAVRDARCRGIAFAFPDELGQSVRGFLQAREGKDFPLKTLPVVLDSGIRMPAEVPLFAGRTLATTGLPETAALVIQAQGTAGSCSDYVAKIVRALADEHIDDPAVTALWQAVERLRTESA